MVWIFGVVRKDEGEDERKKPEERTQVSNHLPMSQAEKVQQSYLSKRQGQH